MLRLNVAELLRRPGSQKEVRTTVPAHGLRVVDTTVPDGSPIDVDLLLESLTDGIVATGRVRAAWEAACRRCLAPVSGQVDAEVRELYRPRPDDDEAFALDGEQLDLEPLVREAVLLELPLAPLCRADCAGLCPVCGADRNEGECGHDAAPKDVRWAALDELLDPSRLDRPDV